MQAFNLYIYEFFFSFESGQYNTVQFNYILEI